MDTRSWGRIRRACTMLAVIAMAVVFVKPAFAADKEVIPSVSAPEYKPAAINPGSKMVGSETCTSCHAETAEKFGKTFHGRKSLSNKLLVNSCESCHGAGGDHADGGDISKIINPKKLDAAAGAELCLTCHKDKTLTMWKTGAHATNEVSCVACHNIHETTDRKNLAKGSTESCMTCHTKQKAEMRLASHHPVPEGKMSCVSCHNPHGGIESNLKADSETEGCYKCHGDKAGPFAFEHAPVLDGCNNCHTPHGSSNDKLLKQSQPYLCLNCHRNPHAAVRSGAAGQQALSLNVIQQRGRCTDCHNQIHGSDRKAGLKD